jgi:hypothetical protein
LRMPCAASTTPMKTVARERIASMVFSRKGEANCAVRRRRNGDSELGS